MPGWYWEPVWGATQEDKTPPLAIQAAPSPDCESATVSVAQTSPRCQAPSVRPPPSIQPRPGMTESSTVTSRRTNVT